MHKMDITLAEAEQNYKNQMFKKGGDPKQDKSLKVLRSESQVVENNAVNKTNIWPNTSSSGMRSQ